MNPLRTSARRFALTFSLALTSAVAVATAGATAASAGVLVLPDPNDDVLGVNDYGLFDAGDADIDLRSVRIDHQPKRLVLTHTFDRLTYDSFTAMVVRIDTNNDWTADYVVGFTPDHSTAAVKQGNLHDDGPVTCESVPVTHIQSTPGTIKITVPRSCIGNPKNVSINSMIMWGGESQAGGELYFVDTAPGEYDPNFEEYSSPVRVQQTTTVTPVRASKIVVSARKPGRAPLSVKVASLATPKGTLTVKLGGRKVTAKVTGKAAVKVKLPRSLKRGTYKATLTFTPTNPKVIKKSTKSVIVRIR